MLTYCVYKENALHLDLNFQNKKMSPELALKTMQMTEYVFPMQKLKMSVIFSDKTETTKKTEKKKSYISLKILRISLLSNSSIPEYLRSKGQILC